MFRVCSVHEGCCKVFKGVWGVSKAVLGFPWRCSQEVDNLVVYLI